MRLFVSLALFFLADAFELGDVAEFSTPDSKLRAKCEALQTARAAFHRAVCYVRSAESTFTRADTTNASVVARACDHLRGFKAQVARHTPPLAAILVYSALIEDYEPTHFANRTLNANASGDDPQPLGALICRYSEKASEQSGKSGRFLFTADNFRCDRGWRKHETHCFRVYEELEIHANAAARCTRENATLAVPHTDAAVQILSELAYHANIANKDQNSLFWIGLSVRDHRELVAADGTPADHFRWLPLGHKRALVAAFKTPNTAVALASSAANTGHVGVYGRPASDDERYRVGQFLGYHQVINGNFHKLPFVCQKLATNFGRRIYIAHSSI